MNDIDHDIDHPVDSDSDIDRGADHQLDHDPVSATGDRAGAVVDADIEADPAVVWRALTSDAGFAAWMGDDSRIDPVVGGSITSPDPASGRPKHGRVERVDDGSRLDFTWWPSDDTDDASSVSIVIGPCETGTRIRVIEKQVVRTDTRVGVSQRKVLRTDTVRASWNWRCSMLALSCAMARC